jgi:DNA integrity scanning protein DisA with diadenylate cyclase activity
MTIQSENKGHEDIDSAVAILHSEIAEVKVNTASNSIDKWIDIVNGYKDEPSKGISANLKELNKLLKGQNSDAAEIVKLLGKLGEQTTAVGDDAAYGVKGPLHTLGKALITFSHKVQRHANAQ